MLGFRPLSSAALSSLDTDLQTANQTVSLRYASQSFVTRTTDNPALTFIPGRINRGLTIGRRVSQGENDQFGSLMESVFGEVELNNADGALDLLVTDYYADGRPIRLKIGATEIAMDTGREEVQPLSNFALVYQATAGPWSFEHDVVRLQINDLSNKLDERIQLLSYSGAGDEQGNENIAGRSRPLCFGNCQNISAQLVDPNYLTYQVHSGSIEAIDAVYDSGSEVTAGADYASYDAMVAATLADGTFGTCLAEGYFRLARTPSGTVTADVRGDNDATYVNTHAGVLQRIVVSYSALTTVDIDASSFADLDASQPAEMGFFLPAGDSSTIKNAIEIVAASCGAVVGDRSGLIRVQRLESPSLTQHWSFDDRTMLSIEREIPAYGVPWKCWGVGYAKNWTIQTSSELVTVVTQERRQFLESEFRYAYDSDATIALAHATSKGVYKGTLFLDADDAEAEATRLLTFYALGRALYRIVVKTALFSVHIGQTVRLTYNRWNLSSGRRGIVIGVEDDADTRETTILVFA